MSSEAVPATVISGGSGPTPSPLSPFRRLDNQQAQIVNSAMRILVVEDDRKIASFVVNGLKQSGYAVDHAADGEDGLFQAQAIAYDAAVIDVMLPLIRALQRG